LASFKFTGFALLAILGLSSPLLAHDPPEEYYGRIVTIDLAPAGVRVAYHLELSQVSLFNLPRHDEHINIGTAKGRGALEAACMERFKVLVPDKVLGFFNDQPLTWVIEKSRIEPQDSSHFYIYLRCNWKPRSGPNKFELTDSNFPEAPGTYKMKESIAVDLDVTDFNLPLEYAGKGTPPEKEHTASFTFEMPQALAKESAALPPLVEEPPPPQPQTSIWQKLWKNDLAALLSTEYGLGLLLLLALIHGAGHSLMPGHGKTMVAAYLVGERGTPWHAVLLGIVTTLTHTSAAIVIAVAIRYAAADAKTVNTLLLFVGGLMMAGIGLWLFLQRLAGRSDHVHLFDMGHSHSHGESAAAPQSAGPIRLVLLGIAGGIIPCWGAILWVIGCIATSQFWLALPVVVAFSIGLSSVLILIGLSVVYSGRAGNRRWGERAWFQRVVRWLPVFGATVVVAIGLFMCATSGISSR
jgi:ABC-type nickel/cobalt efflux system permease component RcnA